MKKKVAMLLTCVLALSLCACGGEENSENKEAQSGSKSEVVASGEEKEVSASTEQSGEDTQTGGAEVEEPAQEGLGFRGEVDYQGINEAGTDTDKLAFLAGDTVHIFDFGDGCNMAAELVMGDRGMVTSMEEDVNLYFTSGSSPRNEDADFGLYREGIHIGFSGIEREGEMHVPDDVELITSEDGTYTYMNSHNMEGFYDVSMTPEGGSFPVVVDFNVVDSLDVLFSTVEWMKTNYRCYKLVNYEDITSAVDIDGNWVDLSSYIFYEDILARELKDYFGIVVKDYTVFEDGTSYNYDLQLDTLIEANLSHTLAATDFTEEDAIDFLGYKAYVIPGKEIYLQYNFNDWSVDKGDVISFEIHPKEKITTVEETLAYLEDRLFSDKMLGEE